MSVRTNPMKAVAVLLKRVKTAKSKFHQSGRDETLDAKLEKLTRKLNKIDDVFMKVKKNQDELVDTLHEVDDHLHKLDRKKLNQDIDHLCKRIRDCAHNLGVRYLNFGSQWLDKSINLKVLQLGRSQDSPSHHIEVGVKYLEHLQVDLTNLEKMFLNQ